MADVTITAASVAATSGATIATGTLGATLTQGQGVAIDTSDSNKLKAWDNTSSTLYKPAGILLNAGSDGQPADYVKIDATFTPGFTVTVGTVYCTSAAGGIAPVDDNTTGDRVGLVGVGVSTTQIAVNFSAQSYSDTASA